MHQAPYRVISTVDSSAVPLFLIIPDKVSIPMIMHVLTTLNFTSSYRLNKTFVLNMISCVCVKQAFSLMGIQASCGQPFSIKKHFIFHMLPYKLLIWAGPIAHFGWPLFKFWLKACLCTFVWISQFCTYDINHQILHWSYYFVYYHSNFCDLWNWNADS